MGLRVEEFKASVDEVLGILQGQISSLSRLKSDQVHDDLSDDVSSVLRNMILESVQVAAKLNSLRKAAIGDDLDRDGLHREREGLDNIIDLRAATNGPVVTPELVSLIHIKQEERVEDLEALNRIREVNLESLGAAERQDSQSLLLQLALNGPPCLLWQITMSLNGQSLVDLQLASGVLRDWVNYHVFDSNVGLRTLRQKLKHWMHTDLTALKTVSLRCKHPVDSIGMDTKQIMLVSEGKEVMLFERHHLESGLNKAKMLEFAMRGGFCFNGRSLVLQIRSDENSECGIYDRATLQSTLEVNGVDGYKPVRLNQSGDVLFMGSPKFTYAGNGWPTEYRSIKLGWRDARNGGPALCFIDLSFGIWNGNHIGYLHDGEFLAVVVFYAGRKKARIIVVNTSLIERSEMTENEDVEFSFICGKRLSTGLRATKWIETSAVRILHSFYTITYVRPTHFVLDASMARYRHPYVFFASHAEYPQHELMIQNVNHPTHVAHLKLHEEHSVSHFAVNDYGMVVSSGNLLHVYAIGKDWLDEAWKGHESWAASKNNGRKMDARSAYVRTQVLPSAGGGLTLLHLDNSTLAYAREEDRKNVIIVDLFP